MIEKVKKMNLQKKRILVAIICALIAMFSAVYYYSLLSKIEIPLHSDDADSAMAIYDENVLGGQEKTDGNLQIFMIVSRVCYFFLGYNEAVIRLVFAILFFMTVLCSLYLIIDKNNLRDSLCVVPLFLFMVVLQGTNGAAEIQISKFHVNTTICFLGIMIFFQKYMESRKKKYLIVMFAIGIFAMLQLDYILAIPVIILPILFYLFLYLIHNDKYRGQVVYILLILPVCLLIIRIISKIYKLKNGKDLIAYNGWGAKTFSTMSDLENNFQNFWEGLFGMFNCNAGGESIISYNVIIYLVRMIIVFIFLIILLFTLYKLIRYFSDISVIDGILSLSCVFTIIAYFFSGFEEKPISMRYCNVVLYALPILALRYISKFNVWKEKVIVWKKERFLGNLFAVASIVLIFTFIRIPTFERVSMENDEVAHELKIHDNLKFGIAPFWAGTVMSVLTNQETLVQPITLSNKFVEPFFGDLSIFGDKSAKFNFIIEDTETNDWFSEEGFGVTEANIREYFGEPEELIKVTDNKSIYVYDYDIRTIPTYIANDDYRCSYSDETSKGALEKGQNVSIEYSDFEIGEYYIILNGKNLNDQMKVLLDNQNAKLIEANSSMIKYLIKINQYSDNHIIKIVNDSNQKGVLNNIEIRKNREALDLVFDKVNIHDNIIRCGAKSKIESSTVALKPQKYHLVLYGENVGDLNVYLGDENEELLPFEKGKNRLVYSFTIEDAKDMQFIIENTSKQNIDITNASIEIEKNENVQTYSCEQLLYDGNTKVENGMAEIRKGGIQFGPYCNLNPGIYDIELTGKNLGSATLSCTTDVGENCQTIRNRYDTSEKTSYLLYLPDGAKNVEFIIGNNTEDTIFLNNYKIKKVEQDMEQEQDTKLCYDAKQLFYSSGDILINNNGITLYSDVIQFGPYCRLKQGTYQVEIQGENLKKATVMSTYRWGKKQIEIEDIEQYDDRIIYKIHLTRDLEDVEFLLQNKTNQEISLENYNITKL